MFVCFSFLLLDPIPVTPEPTLKRPTHLDLMPVSNFSPKKSPTVSKCFKRLETNPHRYIRTKEIFDPISMTNLLLRIYCMPNFFFFTSRRIMAINHQTRHYRRHRKFSICEISLSSKRCKRERLFSNWCRFVSNWSAKRMHVLKHRCVLILVLVIQRISHLEIFMLVSFGCLFVCSFLLLLDSNLIRLTYFSFRPEFTTPVFKCCAPLGKNAAITTAKSRVTGAFGFSGWLHGKWTSWPNIGEH